MESERLLPAQAETDLPSLSIMVEGTEIPGTVEVFAVTVTRRVNHVAKASLVLRDGDAAKEDFELSGEDLFIPGKKVTISAGYHQLNDQIFEGIVVKHSIEFEGLGESMLVVECMDEAVKATIARKNGYFYEKSDGEIIAKILKDNHGLKSDIEDTGEAHAEMVQYYVSDWDFAVLRAEANGMLVFCEDGTVVIKKPDLSQPPKFTLIHGETMYDFRAEIDSRYQYPEVKSMGWDYGSQETVEKTGKLSGFTEAGNLSSDELSSVIGLENYQLQHTGKKSDTELETWASAALMRSRLAKIRGSVRFRGVSDIKPGDMIELQGVGKRFNGNVFVAEVYQEMDAQTWETEVEFGYTQHSFHTEFPDIMDSAAGGLVPGITGLQIGKVKNIHEDPDGEHRVQVWIPVLSREDDGIWARVASLDAGDSRGAFFRPEVDDEVVLGFLNGDPRDPVILGMINSSSLPAPIEADESNTEKGFVTRSKMKLIFDDEKVTVTVETPAGNKIVLDDDQGGIYMECQNGNKIEMTSDGILLDSAGEVMIKAAMDVTVEGLNVGLKADAEFKAEGSAGAEVSTSAVAVLKGSLVQIN